MPDNLLKYKIALEMIPNIGSVTAKRLIAYCGGIEEVFKQTRQSLLKVPGVGEVLADAVFHQRVLERAEKEIEFIDKYGIRTTFYTDGDYPERLKQCDDSPILLYSKGNGALSFDKVLAVVGTRNATDYGKQLCDEIVGGLASAGFNLMVVSGLAHGIDTAAHRSCLKNSIPTVGVLAHGLDFIYPAANRQMAKDMLDNGALVTDFITGTMPERNNFLRRNRIIAGLSDATLVVESGAKGGALVTANMAFSYNRDVLACPGRGIDKYSQGCNTLIKSNKAALVTSVEDVADALNWNIPNHHNNIPKQLTLFRELTDEELLIVNCLQKVEKESIDTISFDIQLPMPKTSALLLALEFDGIVKSHPGKFYSLANSYRNS